MKKIKKITITLKGDEIELGNAELKFYLNETQKKHIHRSTVEKFFNNLMDKFNKVS